MSWPPNVRSRPPRASWATPKWRTAFSRRRSGWRAAIERHFWCEELGIYGIAIDGAGKLCRVRTSNAGHVLFANAAPEERARRVAEELMAPGFHSGWGIRTVAEGEARYNPMSYHNGSIWPHDNAMIAIGFANYGLKQRCRQPCSRRWAPPPRRWSCGGCPSCFAASSDRAAMRRRLYPVACAPQAWASAAPLAMLQACLGLTFEPAAKRVILRDPSAAGLAGNDRASQSRGRRCYGRLSAAPEQRGRHFAAGPAQRQSGRNFHRLTRRRAIDGTCCHLFYQDPPGCFVAMNSQMAIAASRSDSTRRAIRLRASFSSHGRAVPASSTIVECTKVAMAT